MLIAHPAAARSKKQPAASSDPGYVLALSTANRFLVAWQSGDLADGIVLLSDGIRRTENADKLEEFFSSGSDRGFEIGAGHHDSGHYSFPVVLVSTKDGRVARRSSFMIVMLSGEKDWVVDKLPR